MRVFKKTAVSTDVVDTTAARPVTLTLKESLAPCLSVTILFFLWGFAYGLLDVLNPHFQKALHISPAMSSSLSAAYFGAYLVSPPTFSGWILKHYGFRITFMTGLAVLSVGCLLMWPSGMERSFGGFCGSMFVVGCGLATLETAADPFLSICGPPKYSEVRLNLAQGFQAIGSFMAPLLASRVFFASNLDNEQGLKNVQWVYLAAAGFVGCLVVLFFFIPMPEITDDDMNNQELEIAEYDPGPFRKQTNLFLAVWTQFCSVGAQVAVANYFVNFCEEAGRTAAESANLFAAAQGLYAFNRFLAGGLMTLRIFRPRLILAAYLFLCFLFALIAALTKGTISIAMLCLVVCFESACFATIFTLGLRGLGRHTKTGASMIVAAISGGAVFPPMAGALATRQRKRGAEKPFHTALFVPMTAFVMAWVYPVYVNIWNRRKLDIRRETRIGITETEQNDDKVAIEGKSRKSSLSEKETNMQDEK